MGKHSSDSDSMSPRHRRHRSRSKSDNSSRSNRKKHQKVSKRRKYSASHSRSPSKSRSKRSRSSRSPSRRKHRSYSKSDSRSRSRERSSRRHGKHKQHRRHKSSSSESSRSERYSKSRSNRSSSERHKTKDKSKRSVSTEINIKNSLPAITEDKIVEILDLTEVEKLSRNKEIESIEGGSFISKSFVSSRSEKRNQETSDVKNGVDFNFGTQAEIHSRVKTQANSGQDILFSPHFFGDPEEREEKYLRRIYTMRLKAVASGEYI